MSPKDVVVAVIRSLTGAHIYRVLPRGLDVRRDLAHAFPRLEVNVVFDIGANVGQSAVQYVEWFPAATVYSFEPVEQTFLALQSRVRHLAQVKCFRLALAAAAGDGVMRIGEKSDMNRLEEMRPDGRGATESVTVGTLDSFAVAHGIDHINYMKIDTEGGDLKVLHGGAGMLSRHRVDVVEVEAGMNPQNTTHVPIESLKGCLESHGYLLFGIYEQVTEWPTQQPQLRRANLVFVSPSLVAVSRNPTAAETGVRGDLGSVRQTSRV